MKKYYFLLVISLFACFSSYAQDTIIFRNGDELLVKVTEVSDTEIKYILWSYLDGPLYTKKISDISSIKYMNNYKETYNPIIETTYTNDSSSSDSKGGTNLIANIIYQPTKRLGASIVAQHRFNRWVAVGGGLAMSGGKNDIYNLKKSMFKDNTSNISGFVTQFFANVTIFFTESRFIPFFSSDIGFSLDDNYSTYDLSYLHFPADYNGFCFKTPFGIIITPKIGVSMNLNKGNFLELSCGLKLLFRKSDIIYSNTVDPSYGFTNQTSSLQTTEKFLSFYNPYISIGYRHLFQIRK